jgi:hypothetical protein
VAVAKKDIAVCEYLLDDAFSYRLCIFDVAKASGNSAHCMKFEQWDARRDCFMDVAVASGDPEACANLEHNAYLENWGVLWCDQCFFRLASEKKDASLCKRIGDQSLMKQCLSELAAVT